jgi:hypothetical protein
MLVKIKDKEILVKKRSKELPKENLLRELKNIIGFDSPTESNPI